MKCSQCGNEIRQPLFLKETMKDVAEESMKKIEYHSEQFNKKIKDILRHLR